MARAVRKPMSSKQPAGGGGVPVLTSDQLSIAVWSDVSGIQEFPFRSRRELKRAAMEWTYVLHNRSRWADVQATLENHRRRLEELFGELGINESARRAIANSQAVEVRIPYHGENDLWEARIFPWEHALTAVTRPLRHGRQLTVVRSVMPAGKAASRPPIAGGKVLFVESAPAPIAGEYEFSPERKLVQDGFGKGRVEILKNPSIDRLTEVLAALSPEVVHFAGCDNLQAIELLDLSEPASDGIFMQGRRGAEYELVTVDAIAGALANAPKPPVLVSFNMFNSAARLAALAVAEGNAHASIGFQDHFDERLAEEFFAKLYWGLTPDKGDLLESFRFAWTELRQRAESLAGSGIVLWGRHPWLAGATPPAQTEQLAERSKIARATPLEVASVIEQIEIDVRPFADLNYSLLHNRRSIFQMFKITKPMGVMEDVRVEVHLNLGSEAISHLGRFRLDDQTEELRNQLPLSLTSTLLRSLRESVRSTVRVLVTYKGSELYHTTLPVTLLAVDEWKDDDENRVWLPSFVLPRDAAVLKIVDSAQKYLRATVDDAGAGFDGYQSVDAELEDPAAGVDLQAQALWWAIASDFSPAYINPPPTYTDASQRLRTPTDIIEGGRGTCIDLALLYAACLEYVEIYPALILLEGHAFPAYWRTEEAHNKFRQVEPPQSAEIEKGLTDSAAEAGRGPVSSYAWYLQKSHYREILQLVQAGDLVPLETVFLTRRYSFAEALEEGLGNLRSRSEFHSLLDVRLAREKGVTPLPIRGDRS